MRGALIDSHLDLIALLLQSLDTTLTDLVAEENILFGEYEREGLGFRGFKVGY